MADTKPDIETMALAQGPTGLLRPRGGEARA